MNDGNQQLPRCVCCQHDTPTQGPRICPLCGHQFRGNGWDGIDSHWRSQHEDAMTYEQFWQSLCPAHRGASAGAYSQISHLDDIRDTLLHVRQCHEAWWLFIGEHPDREKITWVYNYYPAFFGTVRPALFVTFVVKLASLFGTGSNEITLKLIPDIEQDESFTQLWERGRRLHKYRSKLIAHRDIDLATRNYARESGFTYDDLKALLDDTCRLFDSAAHRLRVEPIPSLSSQATLLRVIHALHKQKSA